MTRYCRAYNNSEASFVLVAPIHTNFLHKKTSLLTTIAFKFLRHNISRFTYQCQHRNRQIRKPKHREQMRTFSISPKRFDRFEVKRALLEHSQ